MRLNNLRAIRRKDMMKIPLRFDPGTKWAYGRKSKLIESQQTFTNLL